MRATAARDEPGMIVVVGRGLASELARALGVTYSASAPRGLGERCRVVTWGPLPVARAAARCHPAAAIIWRAEGIAAPFTGRDLDLLRSFGAIVTGDEATRRLLAVHNPRTHHIEPVLPMPAEPRTGAVPSAVPTVVLTADEVTVGAVLLLIKQLVHGGVRRCGGCGWATEPPFDPAAMRFGTGGECPRCRTAALEASAVAARFVVCVAGPHDGGASEMVRWLGIEDDIDVVSCAQLAATGPWAVIDTNAGIEPGWGVAAARACGATAFSGCLLDAPGVRRLEARTEFDADGRVLRCLDPLAIDRALRSWLDGGPATDRASDDCDEPVMEQWAEVLASVEPHRPRSWRDLQRRGHERIQV